MINETGRPDAPYVGARGPRKTKPRDSKKKAAAMADELLTDERKKAPGVRSPGNDKSVKRKKIKIGRGWSAALEMIEREGMTMQDFVKTLSAEELARGQLKGKTGTFVGAPPKWVPTEFYKECIRELMRRGKEMYQVSYLESIRSMTMIANNPAVEPAQRIKAAQFVIERIEGKVPERLELGVSEPWQEILTGIVASVPGDTPVRPFHEGEKSAPPLPEG